MAELRTEPRRPPSPSTRFDHWLAHYWRWTRRQLQRQGQEHQPVAQPLTAGGDQPTGFDQPSAGRLRAHLSSPPAAAESRESRLGHVQPQAWSHGERVIRIMKSEPVDNDEEVDSGWNKGGAVDRDRQQTSASALPVIAAAVAMTSSDGFQSRDVVEPYGLVSKLLRLLLVMKIASNYPMCIFIIQRMSVLKINRNKK